MTSRPTIGQAVVTDPGEGRAGGYVLVAASPDVRPEEAQQLQASPQVTDHLHLAESPGPFFSFYPLPGGRFALARRFVRGTRRRAFNRVVAHTLLVPREILTEVSDEPWLLTTRCRFREQSGGPDLTPAELGERAAAAGLDALADLECLPPADPRRERYALLARRREYLKKHWDEQRLEALVAAAFTALAAGRRILLDQNAASEQLLAFVWSALPAADRLESPWTTHLATSAAGLFRLGNAPDPEATRRELADPEEWVSPVGGEASAGAGAALARAVAGDDSRWPKLYDGMRRHRLRLADSDGLERWIAWLRRGEPRIAAGFSRVEELAKVLSSFRLGPDGEVSEPWIRLPLVLACAASTALRVGGAGRGLDAALVAVDRALEETRWHRALLTPAVVRELPGLAAEGLAADAPAVAAVLALGRLPPVPQGMVERETYLEAFLAAPIPEGALGERVHRALGDLAADLGQAASFGRLSDRDFLRWGRVARRLANAVATEATGAASRLRSSWWRQLAERTWDAIPAETLSMLDDLSPTDRRAVAEVWVPRVAQLGDTDLELLSRLRELAAEDPELELDYHVGRLVAGRRASKLELDQAVARAAALAAADSRTSVHRRSLFRVLRRLLPAAPAPRARDLVGLLLSPRLLPSTKRFLETELLRPTLDAAGPGLTGDLPHPRRLAERGNLLLRIAAHRGRHWRTDPGTAAEFLRQVARLGRYEAVAAFLRAAEAPAEDKAAAGPSFLAHLGGDDPDLLGRLRRAAAEPTHRRELRPFAARMRRLAQ